MTPTMQLRFVKRRVGRNVVRMLQQRWESSTAEPPISGEFWLDVPLALDCEAGATTRDFPLEGR